MSKAANHKLCRSFNLVLFFQKNFLYVFQGQLDDSISENRKRDLCQKTTAKNRVKNYIISNKNEVFSLF